MSEQALNNAQQRADELAERRTISPMACPSMTTTSGWPHNTSKNNAKVQNRLTFEAPSS